MKNNLKELLDKFQITDDLRKELKENEAPVEVKQIAASILGGYFKVTKGNDAEKYVCIQPTCVEFYCHEEQEDGVKDYIVYHKNNTSGKKDIFPLGILHNHVSGIDVTFEKGEDKNSAQRLSFLIREFMIINPDNPEKIDKYPTHLYDALYSQFSVFDGGFKVEWIDGNLDEISVDNLFSERRINVFEYDETHKTKKKKTGVTSSQGKPKKEDYIPDKKLWKFSRK